MSDELTCQNCGEPLKPAMLKCMECGTRVNAQARNPAATTTTAAAATTATRAQNQNVRIIGASTATLDRPRVIGGQPATDSVQQSESARRNTSSTASQVNRSESHETSGAKTKHSQIDLDTSSGEGPTSYGESLNRSRVCECSCGARFRFPAHMAGMRRRCRKCQQPLVLPVPEQGSNIASAIPAADANEVLNEAVKKANSRLQRADGDGASELQKTLSGKQLKEYAATLEDTMESTDQSTIDRRRLAILKLGQSKDVRAFELIEQFAGDPSKVLRQAVATAVGESGDSRGLRLGLALLADKEADVVREAIRSLKIFAHPATIRPLMLAGLNEPMLRVQAIDAVVGFGHAGLAELLEILETRNPLISGDAVTALGRIGDKQAVQSLVRSLDSSDAAMRIKIVEALARIGDRSALTKIMTLLSDPDETVQLGAVQTVQKMPDRRAVKPIMAILKRTQNTELRRQSVIALAATGSDKIVPTLTGLLANADAELKKAIAEALSRVDSTEAAETLATMLHSDDLTVVTKALVGLRKNPVASSIPLLRQLCDHPNSGVRRHAVESLAESGEDSVSDVLQQKLLNDSSLEVRTAAARACGRTGDKRFSRILEQSLRDEPTVRSAALASMGTLDDESPIPAMLASLHDSVPEVRYHAVTGLGKLKADKAIRPIQALLEDNSEMVRLGAKSALENLGIANTRIPLTRRIMKRVSSMIPDSVAGVLPAGSALAGVVVVLVLCGLGWLLMPGSGSNVDKGMALARAKPVLQARWLPGSSDLILLRQGGPADVWDSSTGEFKSKVDVPELAELGTAFSLMSRGDDSLTSWTPAGYQAEPQTIKPPPSELFGLSGDGKVAVYLGRNRRVWTWDAVEGKNIVDFDLQPVPLPVLNTDGSVIAGEDKAGNITLIDIATESVIGDAGDAGNTKQSANGSFKSMLFSSVGNTLAVLRTDRIVLCRIASGQLAISEVKQRIVPTVVLFPDESVMYSAREASLVRLDLTTEELKQWPVSDKEIAINSFSISEDRSLAAVSAEGKKVGWIVNLKDGSKKELSPLDWPAE